jgi:hypothetical protein
MRTEQRPEQPLLELPGLNGQVLPGGTEIYARPGELEFVARIVGMGIRLASGPNAATNESGGDPKSNI